MSTTGFQRPKRFDFFCDGLDVNCPIDGPKAQGKFPVLINVDSDIDGSLSPRAGLTLGAGTGIPIAGKTPVHTIRRINNPATGAWCRVFGTGDSLATELSSSAGTYNNIDAGYSGNPLTSCPWRPREATEPSLYIGDSLRNRKVSVGGVDKQIGLPPPATPPTARLGPRVYKEIGVTNSTVDWLTIPQTGVAGAPTTAVRLTTAINQLVYDPGTGQVCVVVASLTDIGPGLLLVGGTTATEIMVQEVHRGSIATTISRILYDSGTTGLCTIHATRSVKEIQQNAVVKLGTGGGAEYARVLSVTAGYDDNFSFRCVTTSTRAAGDVMQIVDSFRGQDQGFPFPTLLVGENLSKSYIETVTTGAGTGTITYKPAAGGTIDLSTFSSPYAVTGSGAFGDDDYFHLSLYATDLSKISSIRVMFDVDDDSFTRNYYYHTIEQSVLVAAAKGTQTPTNINLDKARQDIAAENRRAAERRATRPNLRDEGGPGRGDDIDKPVIPPPRGTDPELGAPSPNVPQSTTGTGDNQWSEITFHRSECPRSGTQLGLGWSAVKPVRLEITCTAVVTVRINSIVAYGSHAPDVGRDGLPLQYRYRGRDSSTGTVSDYSQASFERLLPYRDSVIVVCTQHPSAECDKLDIERFGGFQDGWLLVGTVGNSSPTISFTDDVSEVAARANVERSDYRVVQPWCRNLAPATGTTTLVAGDALLDNGSHPFPANLLPGTPIIVDGVVTTFHSYISAAAPLTKIRLANSVGAKGVVTWEMPQPVTYGNPLRAIFGGTYSGVGVLFACDGSYLRWSVGGDFDSTREGYYVEAADPSDPLVGGLIFNGRVWVFTSRRLLAASGDPVNGFVVEEIPSGHGLVAPWALAYDGSSKVAWASWDGLYATSGEVPQNLTSVDLKPLFPYGSRPGADTNGISAPVLTSSEATFLRPSWGEDGSLYFCYRNGSAARRCLRYVPRQGGIGGWRPYVYQKPIGFVYAEEGEGLRSLLAGGADATSGKVYTVGGTSTTDDGTGFDWSFIPPFSDFGSWRPLKTLGDFVTDVEPNGATVNVAILANNDLTPVTASPASVSGTPSPPRQRTTHDVLSGEGVRGRNFSVRFSGTTTAGTRPRVYGWEPSIADEAEDTLLRATIYNDDGYPNGKYFLGVYIEANTFNQPKTIRIEYDGGQLGAAITVQHNGLRREFYEFAVPFAARLVRLATTDTDPWILRSWDWRRLELHEVEYGDCGQEGDKFMQGVLVDVDTFNLPVTVRVEHDGGQVGATLTVQHSGRRAEWFSFAVPFVARLVRVVDAATGAALKVIGITWRFNRESPAATTWRTQPTALGMDGYKYIFYVQLPVRSSSTVTLKLFAEGSATPYATQTLVSTGGLWQVSAPIVIPAKKFKSVEFELTAAQPFQCHVKDLVVKAKQFESDGDYVVVRPFGEEHFDSGARV